MFNDPIAARYFDFFQNEYCFKTIIETGTNHGIGTLNLSKYRNSVCTIEINESTRNVALDNFKNAGYTISTIKNPHDLIICSNREKIIYSLLGSSQLVLDTIFSRKTIDGPFLFYLDAHWDEYWPLPDELKTIAKYNLFDSYIIIHDFKVPDKNFAYEPFKINGDLVDLDFKFVKPYLDKINKNYTIFCNEEAEGNNRGILYVIPPDNKQGSRWRKV
jgi:hypothetical protein